MMQAGVCLRQDTETTLPELTEQHRIRLKEEELSGLESETECAAPGLNTLEPECVTAHSGVSDGHHTHTSVIKTEADLGSTHTGDLIKTESPDGTELGYVTHLHPDQTEAEDGGYLEAEQNRDLQDIKLVHIKSEDMKRESSECLVSDLMNTVKNGAGVDQKDWIESSQHAGEPKKEDCKKEEINLSIQCQCGDLNHHCDRSSENDPSPNLLNFLQKKTTYRNKGNIHIGEKLYKCTSCGKAFNQKYAFNVHMRIHTGEKPYKCTQCDKCFRTKCALNVHLRIHAGEKPYKCTQCEKCFSKIFHLNQHQRIHTGEKPYKCIQCGKCFSQTSALNRHKMIHTGEKAFQCTLCRKCFNIKSNVIIHQHVHMDEKHYICIQCGKSFNTKYFLEKHMKIHTDEQPYKCPRCEKCFFRQSEFNRHQRIHTGEKPYKCTQCEKCFNQISNLNIHQRIHTGEKPYQCTQCARWFSQSSSLNRHMMTHTGEKP
ncbi:hypothetical protein COCON_G00020670 [Conger conger]|uniref:C2H2-type domain-containing protein n=1 Tax=Conger conger TaxID=82655 RepID=A0A9Q1DWQ5_CONCO|nr:zinc finger protein 501-like [Conger conger]KAJ8283217.1 hypothetical protein COCON_G00020670 [Conger conger]